MIGSYESSKSPGLHRRNHGRKLKVVLEGNIASGKTTLLKQLSQLEEVQILVEPVNEWRNTGGENLIGRMYQDPKRWSYLFQSNVFMTMMDLHHKDVSSPVCVLERSVFSARYCFVENLHKSGVMDNAEYACYCKLFDSVTAINPPKVDLIVYLRTSPETCYERLQQRGRKEEQTVTLSYLKSLHNYYERWLGLKENHVWHRNTPVMVIDGNTDHSKDRTMYNKHSSTILTSLGIPCLTR